MLIRSLLFTKEGSWRQVKLPWDSCSGVFGQCASGHTEPDRVLWSPTGGA